MNHEIEAYEGELKELREKVAGHLKSLDVYSSLRNYEKINAFTWHKIECGQCGVNCDLLQRNDGKTMCRQCYNDHFEESEER